MCGIVKGLLSTCFQKKNSCNLNHREELVRGGDGGCLTIYDLCVSSHNGHPDSYFVSVTALGRFIFSNSIQIPCHRDRDGKNAL